MDEEEVREDEDEVFAVINAVIELFIELAGPEGVKVKEDVIFSVLKGVIDPPGDMISAIASVRDKNVSFLWSGFRHPGFLLFGFVFCCGLSGVLSG